MFRYTKPRKYLSRIAARHLALALALVGMATTTPAAQPPNVTAEEMRLIPAYCPYTQSWDYGSPESKRWEARVGKVFGALHHYCWGQILVIRALSSGTPEATRNSMLHGARADYQYVLRSSRRDFVLLPEILTRTGEVELRLSLFKEANSSFAQARALLPEYWPAYSHWAEFLIQAGKKAEAKQLVKSGLEYSPGSRVLREQYRLLGGNPSEIVPIVQKHAPESAAETAAPALVEQATSAEDDGDDSPLSDPDQQK